MLGRDHIFPKSYKFFPIFFTFENTLVKFVYKTSNDVYVLQKKQSKKSKQLCIMTFVRIINSSGCYLTNNALSS